MEPYLLFDIYINARTPIARLTNDRGPAALYRHQCAVGLSPHPLSLIQQATSTIRADMNACACTLLCVFRRYLRLLLHQVHGTQTADGGYVVVGKGMEKDSSSKMEAFAIKFNSLGMYSWVSAQFGMSITALCKVFGHSISKYSRTW